MTALRDFEDIIAAMDSNPQWVEAMRSRLLTRELLQLPERIEEQTRETIRWRAESEAKSDDLKALIELAHQRLDKSEDRLYRLEEIAATTTARLDRLESKTDDLAELVKINTARLDRLESKTDDLAELVKINTARLDRLESKTDDLADLVKAVSEQVKLNTEYLKRNTDHIDKLRGFEIERQMYRQIHTFMIRRFNLRRCRVLRASANDAFAHRFDTDVYDAFDAEILEESESVRIFSTDLIAVGRRRGSDKHTYLVAESSYHVNYSDIDRAIKSRAALSKVYPDAEIIAAVHGVTIGHDDKLVADGKLVAVLQADPDA